MSRTVEQRTNLDGFPKAAELIEITGMHALEASDRAILNLLYQHVHDSGEATNTEAEWEISLAQLHPSKHQSNDRVRASLERLMSVKVTVPYRDSRTDEDRILLTHLFDFLDISANEATPRATVRFSLPQKLRPILGRSSRWGRIKAEIVCSMTSKYSIALYELVQLRANLDRCVEAFPIRRFRELLGVPPGAYQRGNDLVRFVLEPAAFELNGLSDIGVQIEARRRSPRAPIEQIVVAWHRKVGDDFRFSLQERQRPKVGRRARLRGEIKTAPNTLPQ